MIKHNERGPPKEPHVDDCCGDGCDPCVWDTYDTQVERYEERKAELEEVLKEIST